MKIAIVHPSLKIKGGAENVVVWLAEELAARGHVVTVITTDYDEDFYGSIETRKYTILLMPLGGYNLTPIKWIVNGWHLRKLLSDYEIINAHNFPAYIWVYFAKRFNPSLPKLVWFCEEPVRAFYRSIIDQHVIQAMATDSPLTKKGPLKDRLKKRTLRQWWFFGISYCQNWYSRTFQIALTKKMDGYVVPKIDLILTNSRYIATTIHKIFGLEAQPCLLGIPDDRFTHQPKVTYENFMFTPTRFFYEKNLFNSIRAVKLMVDAGTFPCEKYVITGSGTLFKDVQRFVADQGLTDIVQLKGFVSEEDLSAYYASASLVVYLPLDETYGLVFPEAGFYSKAVLGPNHGGPTEVIIDRETGRTVDPLDPEAIALVIQELFSDRQKLEQMGKANEAFTRSELTFRKFVDRFLNLIEKNT